MENLPPKANLRPDDIAAFLDIEKSLVYEMIAEGDLPSLQVHSNKSIRIPRDRFLAWYNSRVQEVR